MTTFYNYEVTVNDRKIKQNLVEGRDKTKKGKIERLKSGDIGRGRGRERAGRGHHTCRVML